MCVAGQHLVARRGGGAAGVPGGRRARHRARAGAARCAGAPAARRRPGRLPRPARQRYPPPTPLVLLYILI